MGAFPFFRRREPLDPHRPPRVEYSIERDASVFVDANGAEWQILDFAGGDGWPIERCAPERRVSRWTQHRLFILRPLAIHGRLYHFTRGERRGMATFTVDHLDAQWRRARVVDLPIAPGSC